MQRLMCYLCGVKLLIFSDARMKIILFSRDQIDHRPQQMAQVFRAIERNGFTFAVNEEFARIVAHTLGRVIDPADIYRDTTGPQPRESVMVCYGGDGTLLEGIQRLSDKSIPVAGINFGHLGFLTTATREGVDALFDDIARGRLLTQPRTMLRIEGVRGTDGPLLALNEVAVQRLEASMIKVVARVDSQIVASYNGDGVIVATPTGSTAYSLSAGGPILSPTCACFVISPLAPHNFGMRPVVIPDSSSIELQLHSRRGPAQLSVDNRTYPLDDGDSITIARAEQRILLAVPHNISFYETLHSKMMWDVDIRN